MAVPSLYTPLTSWFPLDSYDCKSWGDQVGGLQNIPSDSQWDGGDSSSPWWSSFGETITHSLGRLQGWFYVAISAGSSHRRESAN